MYYLTKDSAYVLLQQYFSVNKQEMEYALHGN